MKTLFQAVIVAAALAAPLASFAQQSDASVTRAQVRAELVQLENAGYRPGGDHAHYPDELEAAEARVAAQNQASQAAQDATSSAGGSESGSSASGGPAAIHALPVVH